MSIEWDINSIERLKEFSEYVSSQYYEDLTRKYGIVYALEFEKDKVKVGKTRDPKSRFITVSRNCGDIPKRAFACFTDDYSGVETKILNAFSNYNKVSEFFSIGFGVITNIVSTYINIVTREELSIRNEIFRKSEKDSELQGRAIVDLFLPLKNEVIDDSEFEKIKSKLLVSCRMFHAFDCVDYADVINILDVDISIGELNNILIKEKLFDSPGVVSDYSMDEQLMRNITSEYVDFDFTTWKCSSTLVTQKGMDFIRKLLKKELVK